MDEAQEGRFPLEDEVDDEAREDPIEAAPQQLRRVQDTDAQVERPVGVKGRLQHTRTRTRPRRLKMKSKSTRRKFPARTLHRQKKKLLAGTCLVNVLEEVRLLVGGEDGRAEEAPLIVLYVTERDVMRDISCRMSI